MKLPNKKIRARDSLDCFQSNRDENQTSLLAMACGLTSPQISTYVRPLDIKCPFDVLSIL